MRIRQFMLLTVISALLIAGFSGINLGEEKANEAESPGGSKITPAARKSIDKGMKWLISAIRSDGMVGPDIGQPPDLACTAIVGMALLSEGNTPTCGPHHRQLRKVLNAVLDKVEALPDNDDPSRPPALVRRKIGRNADLFLANLFLSQALGESDVAEPDVRRAILKLSGIICRSQGKDGTWGNEAWAPVLGTVLGWECLRGSSASGIPVEGSARRAGEALRAKLKETTDNRADWMQDFYKHASSVRVLYSMKYQDDPIFKECVKRILKFAEEDHRPFEQAGGEEYLAFYLVTECLLKEPQPSWERWYPTVRNKIVRVQNADGSWMGHHCITDRTFCTAAALLTLQAPNFYLPVSDL
ncbi:MAG: hypothetical protein SGJ20_04550 [Planctomycetota bacterium]|nr:hypothetical protein [Planctomycetota bacterium]